MKEEAFIELQAAGIPAAYVASQGDVLTNEQLHARKFLSGTASQPKFRRPYTTRFAQSELSGTREDKSTPAAQSLDTRSQLPLAGLRICDLSWVWAGPYLTMHAAMLGATVVKVENRGRIDTHREVRPFVDGALPLYERAAGHLLTNRNKLSLEVDLKSPGGLQVVRDLIAQSDALVANFTPGVLDRIGLGFQEVSELVGSRGFVYLSLSGFGGTGPWRYYRSLGAHLAELSGLTTLTGSDGEPPVSMGIPFGDPLAGTFGTAALLNSLRVSRERAAPVFLDISQFEVLAMGNADAIAEGSRSGNMRNGDFQGTGIYASAISQTWVAVSVRDQISLEKLTQVLRDGSADSGNIVDDLTAWASLRSSEDAARYLSAAGVDATEVLSVAELLDDEALRSAGFWAPMGAERGEFVMQGVPWRLDGQRIGVNRPAPLIGEHTDEVMRTMLGYSQAQVEVLRSSGAIGDKSDDPMN